MNLIDCENSLYCYNIILSNNLLQCLYQFLSIASTYVGESHLKIASTLTNSWTCVNWDFLYQSSSDTIIICMDHDNDSFVKMRVVKFKRSEKHCCKTLCLCNERYLWLWKNRRHHKKLHNYNLRIKKVLLYHTRQEVFHMKWPWL